MAERMRSDALVDIGGLGGFDDDAVELTRADRSCGALSGEEPAVGDEDALLPPRAPPVAQEQEQPFGQHSVAVATRSEEHTSELQSLMRISYAVFCLKKKKTRKH